MHARASASGGRRRGGGWYQPSVGGRGGEKRRGLGDHRRTGSQRSKVEGWRMIGGKKGVGGTSWWELHLTVL
jgi:hypothetical protein